MKIRACLPTKLVTQVLPLSLLLIACSNDKDNSSVGTGLTPPSAITSPSTITTPTVAEALSDFPEEIITTFATDYPEVEASEIFKRIRYQDNPEGTTYYGIEGLSDDETLEIDAVFTSNVTFSESGKSELLDTLPATIETALIDFYPQATVEEMVRATEGDVITYAILFIDNDEELEVNFDAEGDFLFLEDVLEDDEIPSIILETAEAQNVSMPSVEFEEITFADDTIRYVIEYENDEGESISYLMDSSGNILQIDFEGAL